MNPEIKQLIDTFSIDGEMPKESAALMQRNCTANCNCGHAAPKYMWLHGVNCEYIMWCQEVLKHIGEKG